MRFTTLLLVLAASFLIVHAACGENLPSIKFEKYTLPNGLDVILHEDHALPTVNVNLCYHVGSKNEKPGRTGFAHLFEHLMFEGSLHAPSYDTLEAIGGSNNAFTNNDRTDYYEEVPSNYLELALWLEADRMGFLLPAMTQEKLDLQRNVVKNERRQSLENRPYGKSEDLLTNLIYPKGHPYSWPVVGSQEDLSAASLEDVSDFFKTYYAPNNASLCIGGDFDPAAVKVMVEKYFASIPAGPPIERMKEWVPQLDGVKREIAEDNVKLPKLYMAWPCPGRFTEGEAAMKLLAIVLSHSQSSRLDKALVYEQKIVQEVSATEDDNELSSSFVIELTAKDGHSLDEVEKATDKLLEDLLKNGITKNELAEARNFHETAFAHSLLSTFGKTYILNDFNSFFGDPGKLQWDLERHAKLTAAEIMKYAQQYLDLNRRVLLSIVPQPKLAASGTEADRGTPPAGQAEPIFTPPMLERATLANGLEILLIERHDVPLVDADLFFKTGRASDPAGKPGTCSMTAEMLDEGTESRSSMRIANDISFLGARMSTSCSTEGSGVFLDITKNNLDKGLAIMADVALHPTFPQEELDRRKEIYLGRIQTESKEASTVARKLFQKLLYGKDHPYAQPFTGNGTPESLKAITRDDLVNYYKANYVPNNAALIIVGDLTMEEAKPKFEALFKDWKSGTVTLPEIPDPPKLAATKIYIVDKPGAPQSSLLVGNQGIRRTDPDYAACAVLNNAMGGKFSSRLNSNLREAKGFTYSIYSEFSDSRGIGTYLCDTDVRTEHTAESVSEIIRELKEVQTTKPLAGIELKASKDNVMKSYPQTFGTYYDIIYQIVQRVKYNLPETEWIDHAGKIATVDEQAVANAAKTHLNPDALLIVVVGDKDKIESDLRKLNVGEVNIVNPE